MLGGLASSCSVSDELRLDFLWFGGSGRWKKHLPQFRKGKHIDTCDRKKQDIEFLKSSELVYMEYASLRHTECPHRRGEVSYDTQVFISLYSKCSKNTKVFGKCQKRPNRSDIK